MTQETDFSGRVRAWSVDRDGIHQQAMPTHGRNRSATMPNIIAVKEDPNVRKTESDKCLRPAGSYRGPLPRLPFCEEFDGVNLRKTKTISESIQALLKSQQEAREAEQRDLKHGVLYSSSHNYDTIQEEFEEREQGDDCGQVLSSGVKDLDSDGDSAATPSSISRESDASITNSFSGLDLYGSMDDTTAFTLDFILDYDVTSSTLMVNIIRVIEARDRRRPKRPITTFVKVSMHHGKNSKKQRTATVTRSRDPVFNHVVYLDNVQEQWMHIMCLRVQLYEKWLFRKWCIGEAVVWLDDLDLVPNVERYISQTLRHPFL